jgi:hypothetical protein
MLYKGKAPAKMVTGPEGPPWIQENSDLHMNAISSCPNGDINPTSLAYYFTEKRETAELYRLYAKDRCPYGETWTTSIQISDSFLNELRKEQLWFPQQDFKEFIWHSRCGSAIPQRLRWYQDADLLVGHICGKGANINGVSDNDVQTWFTEEKLF